jgi:S1-C subfamily serine protease
MFTRRAVVFVALFALLPALIAADPWYVDDDEIFKDFTEKSQALATGGKCLAPAELKKKASANSTCKVDPVKPADKRLDPEDVYDAALPGVFLIGSVVKGKNDKGEEAFLDGRLGTAWVLTADGVLVTNWHLFDEVEDQEFFTVMNQKGEVYPVTDVLAVNRTADVAVFRVGAKGLKPLPLAEKQPRVGAWVGVLGHPGDRYFTFTQGAVSRYTQAKRDDKRERWMAITADYAYGSSGSPVLDRTGAVVGMAALTENLDYPDDQPAEAKKDEKPKDEKPAAKGSSLQMVVKLTVPLTELRTIIGK